MPEDQSARTRSVIEEYFRGFNARDLAAMPIGEDVLFQAPVTPEPVIGRDALRPFLENVFSAFDRIVVHRIIVEGEYACAMLDYHLPDRAPIPMVDWFRVVGEQVVEIRPFFDTALLPTDGE